MAQTNFHAMISVDWLTINLYTGHSLAECPETKSFYWKPRPYGTKFWQMIYDIEYVTEDGTLEPFGIMTAIPTNTGWDPSFCALKLDNHLLYRDGQVLWYDLLAIFLDEYCLAVRNIARVDLAADFLYLHGRVSGPQLVQRIKSMQWWKCGTVNCSEHYSMPYSLKWSNDAAGGGYDTDIYLQNGSLMPRVETLTFGTMSSDAQVCIYDKTLELNRSQITIKRNGNEYKESAKEYIRDCHKNAKVFSEKRHTWRIEIRLKNNSCYLRDDATGKPVPLKLEDLAPTRLAETFIAAQDKYFKLVDATDGGTRTIDRKYCEVMRGHKNRLNAVQLFDARSMQTVFCKRPFHVPANKFHRDVINRLDQLGERMQRCPIRGSKPDDNKTLDDALELLPKLEARCTSESKTSLDLIHMLQQLITRAPDEHLLASPDELDLLQRAKEVIERHRNTESPGFVRNIIAMLTKAAANMRQMITDGIHTAKCRFRCVRPSDAQVLLEAADILKAVFVDVAFDERAAASSSIYEDSLERCINAFNQEPYPDGQMLDVIYTVVNSKRYLEKSALLRIIDKYALTPFGQWYRANFNSEVFNKWFHNHCDLGSWYPPLLYKFDYRGELPQLVYTSNSQFNL